MGSPGDGVGFGCSWVNAFGPSIEFEAPNPAKGVSDELPNGSTESVGPFCSEPTTVVLCSVAEVGTFVGSGVWLWVSGPPNRLDGDWVLVEGVGTVNEVFSGTPSNGAGVGSGTSAFADVVGKIDTAGEGVVEVEATGGIGCVVSGGAGVADESPVSI